MYSVIEISEKNITEIVRVRTSEEAHDIICKYMAWKPENEYSLMECE